MDSSDHSDHASWTLDYPFPHLELPPEDVAYVSECLAEVEARFRPFRDADQPRHEALQHVVSTFTKHCSAVSPGPEELRLVAHFVYTIVFLGDQIHRPGFRKLALDYWSAIQGGAPEVPAPIVEMAAEFIDALIAFTGEPRIGHRQFLHHLGMSVAACTWTSDHLREVIAIISVYQRIRQHTIFTLPYLSLWRLLVRVPTQSDIIHGIALSHIEQLAAELISLANDMCSLERDRRTGKQNMILVVATRGRLDIDSAKNVVRSIHDAKTMEYMSEVRAFRDTLHSSDKEVLRYLNFIQTCIRGNVMTMRELPLRYATPPEPGGVERRMMHQTNS